MYVSKIRMDNVRGFHGGRAVELDLTRSDGTHAGWTVIAGRNGSGKTTLLRGLALAISGPAVARNLVPDFATWMTADIDSAHVEVEMAYDPEVDRFASSGSLSKKQRLWAGLAWSAPEQVARGAQPAMREYIRASPKKSAARGPWQDNPAGWFCAAYGPFRRLVGGAGDAQRLMLSPGPVSRMASLFHEDASLAEGVGWLIEQHLRSLEGRPGAEELKRTALDILGDGLLPDGYHVRRVDSEGLWVCDTAGRSYPLREMSDGYRTVAALVVDLLKQVHQAYGWLPVETGEVPAVTASGVVIIDEIDAHLHVSWQQRIGRWLKDHFPNIQFIVTTHSPYICQAADENGLIRLPGPEENSPPRIVEQALYERIVYGSGDDAILSELFGLESPYSTIAGELRAELVELELAVGTGHATDADRARYLDLEELLTSSSTARVDEIEARLGMNRRDHTA